MIKFCCYSKCDNFVGEIYVGNDGVLYLHLMGCSFTLSLNGSFSDGDCRVLVPENGVGVHGLGSARLCG